MDSLKRRRIKALLLNIELYCFNFPRKHFPIQLKAKKLSFNFYISVIMYLD